MESKVKIKVRPCDLGVEQPTEGARLFGLLGALKGKHCVLSEVPAKPGLEFAKFGEEEILCRVVTFKDTMGMMNHLVLLYEDISGFHSLARVLINYSMPINLNEL